MQGRLTKDELDERVGRALVPLTYAELAALTGDLPDGLTAARRPHGDGQGMTRLQETTAAKAGVFAGMVAGVAVVAAIGNGGNPLQVLAAVLLLSPVWLLALAGLLFLHARLEKHAARRVPPDGRIAVLSPASAGPWPSAGAVPESLQSRSSRRCHSALKSSSHHAYNLR